jgi:hypothetical protein
VKTDKIGPVRFLLFIENRSVIIQKFKFWKTKNRWNRAMNQKNWAIYRKNWSVYRTSFKIWILNKNRPKLIDKPVNLSDKPKRLLAFRFSFLKFFKNKFCIKNWPIFMIFDKTVDERFLWWRRFLNPWMIVLNLRSTGW